MRTEQFRYLGYLEGTQAFCSERYPFNAVAVLRFKSTLSHATLRKALATVQKKHPLLNVSINGKGFRYRFQEGPGGPPPVHRLYSTDRDAWIEAAEDCLNLPFGSWPLLKCILVKNAGGWDDLVVSAMHAVIDVASGTRFLNELLETYDALQRGEVVPADQSFPFPERAERLFPRPYRGIRSLGNVASFLSRQIREEIFYRRKREKGSRLLPQESVRCRLYPLEFSQSITTALTRQGRRRRLTINSLLIAAMLRAVDRELYGGRAQYGRFITVADLRPNLGLVEEEVTLASYFSMLRLGARLDGGSGMESLAEVVNGQVYEALRRGDQYSALLLSPMTMRLALRNSRERMADVALSFSGRSGLVEERSSFQLVDWRACVSNFPVGPPCTAQARVFGGRLKIDFLFLEPETEPALVKRVLECFEQELIQWLANSESAHGTNP